MSGIALSNTYALFRDRRLGLQKMSKLFEHGSDLECLRDISLVLPENVNCQAGQVKSLRFEANI